MRMKSILSHAMVAAFAGGVVYGLTTDSAPKSPMLASADGFCKISDRWSGIAVDRLSTEFDRAMAMTDPKEQRLEVMAILEVRRDTLIRVASLQNVWPCPFNATMDKLDALSGKVEAYIQKMPPVESRTPGIDI